MQILVVEDNADTLELVTLVLQRAGYDVVGTPDGETAIVLLEKDKPSLMLVDIQLPGIDGLELTKRIRSLPDMQDVVILAFTAYAMRADQQRAAEAGCDGYVAKPISIHTLLDTVAQYLDRGRG